MESETEHSAAAVNRLLHVNTSLSHHAITAVTIFQVETTSPKPSSTAAAVSPRVSAVSVKDLVYRIEKRMFHNTTAGDIITPVSSTRSEEVRRTPMLSSLAG